MHFLDRFYFKHARKSVSVATVAIDAPAKNFSDRAAANGNPFL